MNTQLPEFCHYKIVWHAGEPEQKTYPRKSREHVISSERFESGKTLTSCSRCGALACDY